MTLLGTTTLALRLSLGIIALSALGACSGDSTDATPQAAGSTSESVSTAAESPTESPTEDPAATASASADPSAEPSAPASATTTPSASTPPAPTPTAAPAKKPRLIPYAGGESPGVVLHERADAQNLTGSPASFKSFIGDTAQRIADASDCDAGAVGVTVEAVRTDGYAVGGVNDCGGYAALWAQVDGRWKEIDGTQDSWECAVLKRYTVPSDIAGTSCYDYDAGKAHHYHQR